MKPKTHREKKRILKKEDRRISILIAEDTPFILDNIKQTLESDENFIIYTAYNGQEALEMMQKWLKPDLLITDVNMPLMGGLALYYHTRDLYEKTSNDELPIIFHTSCPRGILPRDIFDHKKTFHMQKGSGMDKLHKLVKSVISRPL